MKRARDDGTSGPQPKRPASVSGESSEQPRLTTDDALQYLKAVKEKFKDDNGKYAEFLEVMKDFKAQRIDTAGVIGRVKDLFKGHNKLIIGFNAFLPKNCQIVLPDEPPKKQPVEFDQAINFVNKIKTRFQDNEQVYKAFLEILNKYRKGTKSISEVYEEVACLFGEHPDLLDEFTRFLPDTGGSVHATPRLGVNSNFRKDGATGFSARPSQFERMVKKEKVHLGPDRETERGSAKVEKEQRRKAEKERDRKDDREKPEKEREDLDRELDLDGAQRLPQKRKSARRADELIRRQSQTGEGASIQKEFAFFEKVKGRLRNRESYKELLKILNLYNEQIINRIELQSLATDILGKHPDLLEGFNDLLIQCENADGCLGSVFARKLESEGVSMKTVRAERERDKDHEREKNRDKEKDSQREREKEKEKEKERDRDRERERDRDNKEKDRDRAYKEGSSHKLSLLPTKEKYLNKPISELDLSNCESCTPSYRLLPKNYPRLVSSHRNDLASSVLNDCWVSVTSGSEDYSFKHMRRNQYEESLFRCEDDRFELDMLLESTIVTAKHVAELVEQLQKATKQETQIRIDDKLSAINLRCIERIYGDHGLDILDLIRKNPAAVLPVVHARLKQKQEEWSKCRADMNKVWAEVYAKNYHKSLDHRSFYFKQQDKRSVSTKGLLAEIKEVHENKRKEDDSILSTIMGNRRLPIPDLKFCYPDPSIHADLFQIMKHSADEVCNTMEQSDKIMRVWTTFLEPMFGVPSRPRGTEDTEEAVKVQGPALEQGSSSGESAASADPGSPAKASLVLQDECTTASSRPLASLGHQSHADIGKKDKVEDVEMDISENDSKKHADSPEDNQKADVVPSRSTMEISPRRDGLEASKATHAPGQESNTKKGSSRVEQQGLEGEATRKRDSVTYVQKTNANPAKAEREEGELSPSPDIDERQSVDNHPTEQASKDRPGKHAARQEDYDEAEGDVDADVDHDADADDEGEESAQKFSEDSENASEAGEEVSGSDLGEPDDASREDQEDHEEDEDEDGDGDEEHEEKAESECEAEGMADADDTEGDGISSLASSDRSSIFCKPLAAHASSVDLPRISSKDSTMFYGNDLFYILFRLHQTLYERICSAKTNAIAAEQKWKMVKDSTPPNLYEKFVRVLYDLLDGSADNAKFEDECRSIIGTQSYVLFTLDKLIFKLVKQLQAIAADETTNKLLALHAYEKSRASAGFSDLVYHANACVVLYDENIYCFEHRLGSSELLIQLMDGGSEKLEVPANAMEFSFSSYLSDFLLSLPDSKGVQNVFLERNKRKFSKSDDSDDSEALLSAMKNVEVLNGLEYKISCKTSKVFYVLDTEDIFHRHKEAKPGLWYNRSYIRERRQNLFEGWIEKRLKGL